MTLHLRVVSLSPTLSVKLLKIVKKKKKKGMVAQTTKSVCRKLKVYIILGKECAFNILYLRGKRFIVGLFFSCFENIL